MQEFDVAIIGCGPVGGIAANLLGRAGLKVIVVEREAAPHPLPRAVHIDHEIMRILQSAGLAERIAPLMRDTQGHMHIGADGGVIRYLGTAGRPRPFGWSGDYFFYQPELERELRAALSGLASVELRLGSQLVLFTQDAGGVVLTLGASEAEETIKASWMIACDGASSSVRKQLGVQLEDLGFDEPWLVVDAEVDGTLRFPDFTGVPEGADLSSLSLMLCDPSRPTTVVPGRGNHRRWEFMLLPGEDQGPADPDLAKRLMEPWIGGLQARVVRAATYRFHALIAEHWKCGRVFLAGDAAHQTPPFFGQGMCHGFRDVANLAWKMERVVRGGISAALLEDYQAEREPQVRSVIASAVEAGRYICMRDLDMAADRDAAMRARAGDPVRTAADLITPIRGLTGCHPVAGARFIQPRVERPDGTSALLDDITGGGFVLVLAEGEPEPSVNIPAFVSVVRSGVDFMDVAGDLAAWMNAHQARAVLVRPDFYVFDAGSSAAALIAALDAAMAALKSSEAELCHA